MAAGAVTAGITAQERILTILEKSLGAAAKGGQSTLRASGERTKSEDLGCGDTEFVPWQIGAVM